jgi:hypothetical protein
MSTETIFQLHLVLGYALVCSASACTSCPNSGRWTVSKHTALSRLCTAFASSGSSLFFLASSAPTCPLVSPRSPHTDLATGLLAMLALLTVRIRRLFWLFVVAFNLVGAVDIILDYYHAIQAGLPAQAVPANWAHNVCHPGYPRACTTPGRRTARSRRLIMLG